MRDPPKKPQAISTPYSKGWKRGGLLILGESNYPWKENGEWQYPRARSHARGLIPHCMMHWETDTPPTMRKLFRALADKEYPTKAELRSAWRGVAFANYIGEWTLDPHNRPSWEQWQQSKVAFRPFLERVKPSRVLVCGHDLWKNLPRPGKREENDGENWRRYRLKDGSVVVCRRIRHPGGTRRPIAWNAVRDAVAELRVASQLTRGDRIELVE